MRKRKRDVEIGSLSFLDVVCCGFGAVILLLVIKKIMIPTYMNLKLIMTLILILTISYLAQVW